MPSKSKKQQKFMGMVYAFQKGKLKNASPEIEKAAKSIDPIDAEHLASTKHKGLPEKVKKKKKKKKKMNENIISFTNYVLNEELEEGKSKSNQKYGPVICNDCGHKADGFEFKRAFKKDLRCPKCKSKSVSNAPRPKVAPAPQVRK